MFWSFMNKVHGLPTIERKDIDPWWNEEESKIKDFVYGQLVYVNTNSITLVEEKGLDKNHPDYFKWCCIGPSIQNQDGKLVFGLDKEWSDFISKHVDVGAYIGSVTYKMDDMCFICYSCGSEYNDEDVMEQMVDKQPDVWMFDCNGFGRRFDGSIQQKVDNKACCPVCSTECETAWFEECDIDTVWVFEKGSIIFCHYGRGAGISFKFHSSFDMEGLDPLTYFSNKIEHMDIM